MTTMHFALLLYCRVIQPSLSSFFITLPISRVSLIEAGSHCDLLYIHTTGHWAGGIKIRKLYHYHHKSYNNRILHSTYSYVNAFCEG